MNGTNFSVTEAIRFTPPIKITTAIAATAIPIVQAGMLKADSNAFPIALDCTIFPIKPNANTIRMEKIAANTFPNLPLKAAIM